MLNFCREIFLRRDLIRQLVIKDLKIRYQRPALGFFWAFLSPFLMAVIFYFVFSVLLKIKIAEAPFILYLMSAVFPWSFFQNSLMSATTSIVDNKNLVKESTFPHYLIPVSVVLANLVTFLPSLLLIIITSVIILKGIPLYIIFLPVVLLIHLIIVTGLSLLLSLVYIRWRDIRYILEAALLFLFYLSPAFYSVDLVKTAFSPLWFKVYIHNPLVCILYWYRICILQGFSRTAVNNLSFSNLVVIPAVFAILILSAAFYYYRRSQKTINDYLY